MSRARLPRRAARTRFAYLLAALTLPVAALALVGPLALGALPGSDRATAVAATTSVEAPVPQTDASVPAVRVTMIGATPLEAPSTNETWGVGVSGSGALLVRYTKEMGWTLGPALPDGFVLDKSVLAGQMTPSGAGVLVGTQPSAAGARPEVVLVRDPGGAFAPTAPVPTEGQTASGEEPLMKVGEKLFVASRAPLLAPLHEAAGGAGALVVPVWEAAGVESQVLHWDGQKWSSEPIEIPSASKTDFRVLALGASDPEHAWLLAQLSSKASYPAGAVALFRRVREGAGAGAKWIWKPATAPGGEAGEAEPLTVPVQQAGKPAGAAPFTVRGVGEPPTAQSQLLTVTSEGVWIDGERGDVQSPNSASTTLFFKPEAERAGGSVEASWCQSPPEATPQCSYELPEALPRGPSRSIAWADGSTFGRRVVTGLPEGVSLSLATQPLGRFERVLALGAGPSPDEDPGATYGAAFTSPEEGWLGENVMPVHLTREPAPSRLAPWPTSFRHPLLAIAPQPGAPVGALSSEALAVGDMGAVARFKPGVGWLPESLFGVGQRVEHPRLRAVAWPTPTRAYAVGDYSSEESNMWLWRGETGLWEPDPAMPLNFRGNLLGVAFDPNNPARGYAVGSSVTAGAEGVLLRYGKTWTQETGLPSQVQGANFVSIAFAGSEAIVAYRVRDGSSGHVSGGLLVNEGSGWRVDEQAVTATGGAVPGAVAGLPDGGAAFIATAPEGGGTRIYERESAGSPWQATAVPLPGVGAGSLALFREGDALRTIVSAGGIANEGEPQSPPPGFPSSYLSPLSPIGGGPQSGGMVRQTATGWSDESHELNPAGEAAGGYVSHDMPYRLDPILAVLVDPTGTQGWAVGGNIDTKFEGRLETGDVDRYPADGVAPLGAGTSPVSLEVPERESEAKDVTFAIGGNAQCSAPCGDRARAGVGPDVWLRTVLERARGVGVRAFLYTGPFVTQGKVNGPRSVPILYAQELETYASMLRSASPLPVYAAVSPQELDARPEREGSEATFERELAEVEPFGDGVTFGEVPTASKPSEAERQACAHRVGCEAAYYAFDSQGSGGPQDGTVRVIVLDNSADVEPAQLQWLEAELESAKSAETPAVVVGNADLKAQASGGDVQAAAVVAALVGGSSLCRERHNPCGASAYFYDSPEENVRELLRAGGESIEAFGSGTLGYVNVQNERSGEFHGASGFLLGQVVVAKRNPSTNRVPVEVRLIPNIGELALEAQDGTLLRRSNPALFEGLARRPRAGDEAGEKTEETEGDPYIPIPENCVGAGCETSDLFPEYTFSSSRPDIGGFVKPNLAVAGSRHAVLVNAKGEPEREPINEKTGLEESKSGLFCAYNAGTTTVTISAGGLAASLPVTVEAGSVREPCGTVLLKNLPAAKQQVSAPAPPPPAPAPAAAQPAPASTPPLVPLPPAPPLPPPARTPAKAALPSPFVPLAAVSTPVLAFVPPPVPTPARPSPPTGTSAVTSPIEVAEREEEEESATEQASNLAVAYRSSEDEPASMYLLGVLLLAAFAGASIRRSGRGRRGARVAPATISTMRSQRRWAVRARRDR